MFPAVNKNKRYERKVMDDGTYQAVGLGTYKAPSGTEYTFQQYPVTKWGPDGVKYTAMQFKPTQMRNYPIQGESSLFVQAMAGLVVEDYYQRRNWDGLVYIINQVHDALYFDVYEPMLKRVVKIFKPIMEDIPRFFRDYGYDLKVPFPVEAEAGVDMYSKHHVE